MIIQTKHVFVRNVPSNKNIKALKAKTMGIRGKSKLKRKVS